MALEFDKFTPVWDIIEPEWDVIERKMTPPESPEPVKPEEPKQKGFVYMGENVPLAVTEGLGGGFTYIGEKPPIPSQYPAQIPYEDAVRAWSSLGWGERMRNLGTTEATRASNVVQQAWIPEEIGSMAWGQSMQDVGLTSAMQAGQVIGQSWIPPWEWEPWMLTPPAMGEEVALQNRIGAESIGITPRFFYPEPRLRELPLMERTGLKLVGFGKELEEDPLTRLGGKAIRQVGELFTPQDFAFQQRRPPPETIMEGIQQGVVDVGAGFLQPRSMAILAGAALLPPLAGMTLGPRAAITAGRAVPAYFTADMTIAAGESLKEGLAPNVPAPERAKLLAGAAASGLMAYGAGRQTLKPSIMPRAERLLEREAKYAAEKGLREKGGVTEHQGIATIGLPAEAGGSYRLVGGPQKRRGKAVAQAPQVLLSPETERLLVERSAKLGTNVELVDVADPANSQWTQLHGGNIATIDRVKNRILLNARLLNEWLSKIPESRRGQALTSLLWEEKFHLLITDLMARAFWDRLSEFEKGAARRAYTGSWYGDTLPDGTPIEVSELNFAHEAYRQHLQRLSRMGTREVVEAVGAERWKLSAIEKLAEGVMQLREKVSSIGEELGSSFIGDSILNKVEENLKTAREAATGGAPAALAKEGERFTRKLSPDEVNQRLTKLPTMPPGEAVNLMNESSGNLTHDAWSLGLGVTERAQVDMLAQLRQQARESMRAAFKEGRRGEGARQGIMAQYWNEAYEAATGTGSSGFHIPRDWPGSKFPFPAEEAAVEPGALIKYSAEDIKRSLEEARLIPTKQAIEFLGGNVPPHYLNAGIDFIMEQREKLRAGKMTPRDVAKSYTATVGSIQAGEVTLKSFTENVPEFDPAANDRFLSMSKTGQPRIRPEDAIAWWFTTPEGKSALDNIEAGKFNPEDWQGLARVRRAFGYDTDIQRILKPLSKKSHSDFNMLNLAEFTNELNAAAGDVSKITPLITRLQGISDAKGPFVGMLLGIGDLPTADAVEINFWLTGKGNGRQVMDAARKKTLNNWKHAGNVGLEGEVTRRISQRIMDLQKRGVGADLPPEAAGAILHHWIWDKAKGTTTPHTGLYEAVRLAALSKGRARRPKLTAFAVEDTAKTFVGTVTRPSFASFVDDIETRFGVKVSPDQLRKVWAENVFEGLVNLPGSEIARLVKTLGLTKSEKAIELNRQAGRPLVADPIPQPTIEELRDMPRFKRGPRAGMLMPPTEEARLTPSQKAQQRIRNSAIAAIGEKLINEASKGRKAWIRSEIGPEQASLERADVTPGYQEVSSLTKLDALARALTDRSGVDRTTKIKKLINGKVVEIKQKAPPESVTRRVTFIRNVDDKTVHGVSTYRRGDGVVMILNPDLAKMDRPHVQLEELLREGRYRPYATVLLEEPVQRFHQQWKNLGEFEEDFAKPLKQQLKKLSSYEPSTGETTKLEEIPAPEAEAPPSRVISPQESLSVYEHILDETGGKLESVQDVVDALEGLAQRFTGERGRSFPRSGFYYQALNAWRKAYEAIKAKWPQLTEDQAREQLIEEVYDKASRAESDRAFVQEFTDAYSAPEDIRGVSIAEAARGRAESGAEAGAQTGTQIGIKRTHGPTWTPGLPKGEIKTGPELVTAAMDDLAPKIQPESAPPMAADPSAPAALSKATTEAIRAIGFNAGRPLRAYSQWAAERLRMHGRRASAEFADAIDIQADRQKELYGALTPELDPAKRAAGSITGGSAWLSGTRKITQWAAVSRFVDVLEGRIQAPPWAQQTVQLLDRANRAIGNLAFGAAGHPGGATGLVQRNLTGLGYDLIRAPDPVRALMTPEANLRERWIDGLAKANNVSMFKVRMLFARMRKEFARPGIDFDTVEKINQDFKRTLPVAVTHLKHLGQWHEVIHANPYNYIEAAAQRASHVAAFRELFANTPSGKARLNKLLGKVRVEVGPAIADEVSQIVAAMQGHPTDSFWIATPFRLLNSTVGNLMSKMVLTGQMFVQPGENIVGSTPMFLGYRNYLRALTELRKLDSEMEVQGKINRAMRDWSFDVTSPIRSGFRIAGNGISFLAMENFLNELQEKQAAVTAHVVADRIKRLVSVQATQAGQTRTSQLSRWEERMLPQTFRMMGFSPDQTKAMMSGDPTLLNMFERRAAAWLTSGNRSLVEGSMIGANRLFNSVFRFQQYPMMKANQARAIYRNLGEAARSKDLGQMADAARMFARWHFGAAMQGAITTAMTTLFYEGMFANRLKYQEAKDEPLKFALEAFFASMSGPLYLLWRGVRDQGVPDSIAKTFFPYAIYSELSDMAFGKGSYRDQDELRKVATFTNRKVPGSRPIRLGLSIAGISKENPNLEAAIKGFYRWKRSEIGTEKFETDYKTEEKEEREFRKLMREAVTAMKDGREEDMDKALDDANEIGRTDRSVPGYLRGRKILKGIKNRPLTDEETESLRKRIGDDAYNLLEAYDDLIDEIAESF